MRKAEFIENISRKTKLPKAQAGRILDTILGEIEAVLKTGDSISFKGFGTFMVSKRKARQGRHPRTGAVIDIAASNAPRFRPGKQLKDALK